MAWRVRDRAPIGFIEVSAFSHPSSLLPWWGVGSKRGFDRPDHPPANRSRLTRCLLRPPAIRDCSRLPGRPAMAPARLPAQCLLLRGPLVEARGGPLAPLAHGTHASRHHRLNRGTSFHRPDERDGDEPPAPGRSRRAGNLKPVGSIAQLASGSPLQQRNELIDAQFAVAQDLVQ